MNENNPWRKAVTVHAMTSRPDAPFLTKSLAVPTGTSVVCTLFTPCNENQVELADRVLPGTKSDTVDQARRLAISRPDTSSVS